MTDDLLQQGLAYHRAGRLGEAEETYRRLLSHDPAHGDALHFLGAIALQAGRAAEAAALLTQAVTAKPDFPPAHGNLGLALARLGRLDEAEACLRRALRLHPGYGVAYSNLAHILLEQGRPAEALAAVEQALALSPSLFEACVTRAAALRALLRPEEAEVQLRDALALRPEDPESANSLGAVLLDLGRLDEAVAQFKALLARFPDAMGVRINLANTLLLLGRSAQAFAQYQVAVEAQPTLALPHRYRLYCAMYRNDLDGTQLSSLHREFGTAMAQVQLDSPPLPPAQPVARLRVGYLSSDFRNHPVCTNILPILRLHDRSKVEIHCYAHVVVPDSMTQAVKAAADTWHDIRALSDTEVAAKIRADGIHILVSLAGRFDQNRPQVCAYRAAPVQISTHDVATSGLAEMDYLIGDATLLPRGGEEYFSERCLRLPSFYTAERPSPETLARLPLPARPRTGPAVLICLNNPAKISNARLRLWGRILASRPRSCLMLKFHQAYRAPSLQARILEQVTGQGATAEQVVMIGEKDTPDSLMLRYNQADIALDTGPFCGSTTSFQALTMGVPVITLPEERMVSRWTASMLRALGLDELIAADADGYVALALKAMDDVAAWRGRRAEIRGRLLASPLCAPERWTRHLERLYGALWRRHCRGSSVQTMNDS